MPDDVQRDFDTTNHPKTADVQTEKMSITPELVMALADRVYAMLIHEMTLECERQRFQRMIRSR
jgi:hypothetical protein